MAAWALILIHGRRAEIAGPPGLGIRSGLNGSNGDHLALRADECALLILRAIGRGAAAQAESESGDNYRGQEARVARSRCRRTFERLRARREDNLEAFGDRLHGSWGGLRVAKASASPASVRALEELQNLCVFLGGEVGADARVLHGDFPLRIVVSRGRAFVVAARAVVRPELGAALAARSGCDPLRSRNFQTRTCPVAVQW